MFFCNIFLFTALWNVCDLCFCVLSKFVPVGREEVKSRSGIFYSCWDGIMRKGMNVGSNGKVNNGVVKGTIPL